MSKNNVKQLLDTIYHLIHTQGVNHPLRLVNVSTINAFEDVENTKDEFALSDDFDIDTYKTACNILMYNGFNANLSCTHYGSIITITSNEPTMYLYPTQHETLEHELAKEFKTM